LNVRTWVPEASMLNIRPPKPLYKIVMTDKSKMYQEPQNALNFTGVSLL
jgi:hypothetical protein